MLSMDEVKNLFHHLQWERTITTYHQ
jgi:hypothetical protein